MKKYRLTKITVKTREIVSMSKDSADDIHIPICPICHSPLNSSLPAAENSAVETNVEKRLATLSPAEVSDEREIKN